jgi:hypothetical protein
MILYKRFMYATAISLTESFVIIRRFVIDYLNLMHTVYTLVISARTVNYSTSINGSHVDIFGWGLI